jgi:DNA repair protein RadA/Sms
MARAKTTHRCTDCGAEAAQWAGRCPACGEWNTLVEEVVAPRLAPVVGLRQRPVPIGEVDDADGEPVPTGIGELDRVLGGGMVPGSVTLLGGEPGIGKSTLVLQALAARAATGRRCLLVTAEESARQVRTRAERLGAVTPGLFLLAASSTADVLAAVEEVDPDVLAVDSVQTLLDPDLGGTPGTVAQVRGVAAALVALAKERSMATVLVGHVTKDGALAGPRVLEHVVDTVLSFEGDRHHALRLLRAVKHRFGPTGELGLFELGELGLAGLPDPSGLFLGDRRKGVPGSVVLPALEGSRPLLVEVQALLVPSDLPSPRRASHGLDAGRLAKLLAVLERHCGLKLGKHDVHVSVVGGVRLNEPAADLAVAVAIVSAFTQVPVAPDVVVLGEVGLAGEVRQVAHTPRRLSEAERLGFRRALIPASAPVPPDGMAGLRTGDLGTAVTLLGLVGGAPRRPHLVAVAGGRHQGSPGLQG